MKPSTVAAIPVTVIVPFKVAKVPEMPLAACTVSVGGGQVEVVKVASVGGVPVPLEFVANGWK